MRSPILLMLCVFAATPAFAASKSEHADCNAEDVDRNLIGCTRVLEDRGESDKVRAIAYVGRALARDAKGDREGATADLTAAIRLDPDNSLAYNNRAIVWRERGDIDRAIADFSEAIAIEPLPHSDMTGVPHVNIYSNRGLAFQAKGDVNHAALDFDRAITIDADNAEPYLRRAQLRISTRDLHGAVADLDAGIRLNPDVAWAYHMRGVVRYELYTKAADWIEQDDLKGAIADFGEAIRRDPDNAQARYGRGLALMLEGEHERAFADVSEAVRLNPLDAAMVATLKALKPGYQSATDATGEYVKWPPEKQ